MQDLPPLRITTSERIVAELLNSAAHNTHLRSAAAEMVEALRADRSLTVVPQTSEQFGTPPFYLPVNLRLTHFRFESRMFAL